MNVVKTMQRWSGRVNDWIALWYENAPPRIRFYLKLEKDNNILKILNSKATLHKHPIYTLESSKHPLNLVRLSL
jgi:hypothetical protein